MEYKYIPQDHKTQGKKFPQIWYNTPSRLNPKSCKVVIEWHGNAKFSYMTFLYLEQQRIWTWNYIVINHIFLSQHPQTHIIYLIQIWYKTTSRLKPNPWRLVIQGHQYAIFSYTYLRYFKLKEYGNNITDPYIIYLFPTIIKLI